MSVSTPRVVAKENYTVGWVCAIPVEMAAARGMLDETHARLPEQDPADHNAYTLGQIQSHNVVIACLPSGMTGTTSAATVAKDMLRTFKSIRFGLMVGIGGGAPSSEHDIRLGDIVVSRPSGTSGGVIQYDRGKALQGEFLRTGSLNAPPKVLLAALASLQADHMVGETQIPELLSNLAKRNAKTRKTFGYPDDSNDCLFEADYQHEIESASTCHQCDRAHLVKREARDDTDPVIHYGNIASGNQVIKNAVMRDRLQKQHSVLCFEMEAAGLMLDFPCMVIRGISDYADSHKNDAWQGYAAATAAAFAKELLLVISPAQVEKEKVVPQLVSDPELHGRIYQVNESIKTEARNQQTRYEDDKHIACHQVFKTSAYESFKDINPDRVPGTCMWVLDHRQYKRWQQSSHDDLLWISADPGCGKSVLAKFLVDEELSSTSEHTACYFFFRDSAGQGSLATALCAILHQLFSSQPQLLEHAMSAYKKNGEHLQHEIDELWRILLAASGDEHAQAVTCVFDALDECSDDDRPKLIQLLTDFYTQHARWSTARARLKFLVTSRAYGEIEYGFSGIPMDLPSIRLAGEHSNADITREISLVIKQKVAEVSHSLRLDEETQDALLDKLQATPHRTYLWLHLVIQELPLSSKRTKAAMMKIIERLPESVEDVYESILGKLKGKNRNDARILLHIIIAASRPLTLSEMDIAFQLATDSSDARNHGDVDLDDTHLESRVRNLCGLFIFVTDNRIYLIHQTAKEFLVAKSTHELSTDGSWKGSIDERLSNTIMTQICVQYLSFDDIDYQLTGAYDRLVYMWQWTSELAKYHHRHRFLEYCTTYWPIHISNADMDDGKLLAHITGVVYDDNHPRFSVLSSVLWASQRYSKFPAFKSIHLAAFNGHTQILIQLLPEFVQNVDVEADDGKTPLMLASSQGRNEIIERLVAAGANLNKQDARGNNSLGTAINAGHDRTVKLLLNMGATVDVAQVMFDAVSTGRHDIIQLLIEKGADVNCSQHAKNPLMIASKGGYNTVIELLLSNGADINAHTGKGGDPLVAACQAGHKTTALLLLSKGAEINPKVRSYHHALGVAAREGHLDIVRMLLDKGANVNFPDYNGSTPLWEAVSHPDLLSMLLQYGAKIDVPSLPGWQQAEVLRAAVKNPDNREFIIQLRVNVDVFDEKGRTLLYYVLCERDMESVKFLLSIGASPNAGNHGQSPMHNAACQGYVDIIRLFHTHGAALDVPGKHGVVPIHYASSEGHLEVVRFLAENGAALDVSNKEGMVPIHSASDQGHIEVVRFLVENGAALNVTTEDGSAPIHYASEQGHIEVVRFLVENGAALNVTTEDGSAPIHYASNQGHLEVVRFLSENGADVNAVGKNGSTPLHEVAGASSEHLDVATLLLERGADVNAVDKYGRTPLHQVAEGSGWPEHLDVANLLLERGADRNIRNYNNQTPADVIQKWRERMPLHALLTCQ